MGTHLKKNFTTQEVIEVLERYISDEIGVLESMALLKIQRRQFFKKLKAYREQGQEFSLANPRSKPTRTIPPTAEQKILEELAEEKQLIEDPNNPILFYNYSYVQGRLKEKYKIEVSLPTIITRAKKTVIIKHALLSVRMIVKCLQTMLERWHSMTLLCIYGRLLLSKNGI